ncbi:hypothetical protein GIB67_015626 [Kingdonia uniflora]|uniref:Uncharacterized protein n=1 Tax=Kingdonia uniflora TaxID=39325 RepID=A0A7J7NUN1_9MAGN|nr:hypothetical protein GIB67_015626 [Kingdonia uniflora]
MGSYQKVYLDVILVPCGLALMFLYHFFLLYRIRKHPHTTVIGYENHNKRAWVERMMQVDPDMKYTGIALQVMSSNIGAATYLASLSIGLSSLIGAWVGSSSSNIFMSDLIYGDTSSSTITIKYISLLTCFLLAFASFIQSTRYSVHANFLMSTPNTDIPVKYVQLAVIRGSNFWSLGLRALYFATTLLLWIFGPIPMFASSVIMVFLLHFLDTNSTPLHQYQPPNKGTRKLANLLNGVPPNVDHQSA